MSQETTITCTGCGRTKTKTHPDGVRPADTTPAEEWIDAMIPLYGWRHYHFDACSKACQAKVLKRMAAELEIEAWTEPVKLDTPSAP